MKKNSLLFILLSFISIAGNAQKADPYLPDKCGPQNIAGYKLVWSEEFNIEGRPDSGSWKYENGFVRNEELQWYQPDNAFCSGGVLRIEGRREKVANPLYEKGSSDWRKNREYAQYSSSCIYTEGMHSWLYGRFEIRARIPVDKGAWPAIWMLGTTKTWPSCGETDIMEYYIKNGVPSILANSAWGDVGKPAIWDDIVIPFTHFTERDADWAKKYHLWRMDWDRKHIRIYLDDELLNEIDLVETLNSDGFNPFHQPHYLLLNLALGQHGGDPSDTSFPMTYEVDYVRVYQPLSN